LLSVALALRRRGNARRATGSLTEYKMTSRETHNHIPARSFRCDVFVYGSTPGGIAAGVEAARRGQKVVIACPKRRPGGMAASGLCTTDAVRRHMFGSFVQEFVDSCRKRYSALLGENNPDWPLCQEGWFYEPSVAEAVFREIIAAEDHLQWLPECWLTSAFTAHRRIVHVDLRQRGQERMRDTRTRSLL